MSENKAVKYDEGKPDLSLVPYVFQAEVAKAMMYGAKKYGRYNYRGGLQASRLVAAAARHLFMWFAGEEVDSESKVSHLAHVSANMLMLIDTKDIGTLKDDRPVKKI